MAVDIKVAPDEKLELVQTYITDTSLNSDYFNISELPDTFSGGKNAFLIAGSDKLLANTEIKIQIIDAAGNICYVEYANGAIPIYDPKNPSIILSYGDYYEGNSKVVAVYVYPNLTAFGPATITILGQAKDVPQEWNGLYSVKWTKQVNINPALPNTTRVRFYKRPKVSITEILQPIYQIVSGSKVASAVTQSFANIIVNQLDTFAGDVARVKVYRTSEGDISDYDLIQDISIEAKNLLTTYTLSGSVVGNAGIFTSDSITKLWNTSSLNTYLTSSKIDNGIRLKGNGTFSYTSSLNLLSSNTYELQLDAFYSGSTNSTLGIYATYTTQSLLAQEYTLSKTIAILSGSSPTKNFETQTFPFTLPIDYPTASLYLSQSSGTNEWHIGNISLNLSQDTAFSPNEINFITSMPTVLSNETYNFKFEFYDVNNNYVPVAVTQSALFTGGNNNIGGTLILISGSTSASNASILALSQSVSGTIGVVTGSINIVSASVNTVSASVNTVSASLSSSISSSKGAAISSSFGNIQTLANGQFSGSFIGSDVIYSPNIGGTNGYISNLFKVGTAPSIYLDARQDPRKIFIGGVSDSGSYNNSNTTVYMDSGGKFSLGDQLSWNGNALTINGTINVLGGNAATDANALLYSQRAVTSGSNAATAAIATASGSAYTMATTSANTAYTNASASAFTQANTAYNNAISTAAADATTKSNTAFNNAAAQVKLLADGGYTGTFISSKEIFSPVIGGTIGYFSNQFRVGDSGIVLDGVNKRIYIGGGVYNSSGTGFYVDNSGNFSLGNKLSFNGSALNVVGAITAESGYIGTAAAGWQIASNKIYNTNVEIDNSYNRIDFKNGGVVKTRIRYDEANIGGTATNAVTIPSASVSIGSLTGTNSNFSPQTSTTTVSSTISSFNLTVPSDASGKISILVPYPYITPSGYVAITIGGSAQSYDYRSIIELSYTITSSGDSPITGTITLQNTGLIHGYSSISATIPGINGGTARILSSVTAIPNKVYSITYTINNIIYVRLNPTSGVGTNGGSITYYAYGIIENSGTALLLAVASRAEYGSNGLQVGSDEGSYVAIGNAAGAGYVGLFAGNVSVVGTLTGGVASSSDRRAKTNIQPIGNALDKIKLLNPVDFDWLQHITGNYDFKNSYGFIADEVEKDFPQLVMEKKGHQYDDFKYLDYNSFHALAIKAIQELSEKIEKLELQISGSK